MRNNKWHTINDCQPIKNHFYVVVGIMCYAIVTKYDGKYFCYYIDGCQYGVDPTDNMHFSEIPHMPNDWFYEDD